MMMNKLLFSLSLIVSPLVAVSGQSYQAVSAQTYTDFDTYHTSQDYLNDFDYLLSSEFKIRTSKYQSIVEFEFDYTGGQFFYYVIPLHYELDVVSDLEYFYSNDFYKFYNVTAGISYNERPFSFEVLNYIGINQQILPILALNSLSMSQVIEHDKTEKSNTISIYNSFYNFFTGFFPDNVVAEYHGIFTFVIVAFLFFLVFGFVFFLFRVIRRLVGFK